MPGEDRLLGSGGELQCSQSAAGWRASAAVPNVGGICIGCTMPGFPDKFMPFMDEPPGGAHLHRSVGVYGEVIRALRSITNTHRQQRARVAASRHELTTGYQPKPVPTQSNQAPESPEQTRI